MGKKKGKKSGKGKTANKDEGPSKETELVKRLDGGYTKRCTETHEQPPIESVQVAIKTAVKEGNVYSQMLLSEEDLIGPFDSSRLTPLLMAVRETGYPFLTQLYFWNTPLRSMDVLVLAQYLEGKCFLQVLEMMDNDLNAFACDSIGAAVGFNKSLKTLAILHNDIGDEGCLSLCKGLSFNQTLDKLHLEYCGIGAEGCEGIGRNIATNGSITAIYLNGNTIEGSGVTHLVRGLASNQTLQRLELQDNAIDIYATSGDDCVSAIEALERHTGFNVTFAYLDLSENIIGDEGGKAVLDLYERRKEAGLTGINILVSPRMRSELFSSINKATKWVAGDGKSKAGGKGKAKKKKSGKKKKK
eukprot:m.113478 g.113478  ORF g.113478 m.113478 type:complete len:358 (+) comp28274_c0_seq1:162-1235(+)